MRRVTSAEANRSFSKLLREASEGERFVVTSHGRPVATLGPYTPSAPDREEARAMLLERLRAQDPSGARDWTRDELYEP